MKLIVPKEKGSLEHCYNSLCSFIKSKGTQPLHKTSLLSHGIKYLGWYISFLDELNSNSYTFIVYDLYVYEGSKFTGRTFMAVYGPNEHQYVSESEDYLKTQSNQYLKDMPVGEAYRRFKKRKLVEGNLTKLR